MGQTGSALESSVQSNGGHEWVYFDTESAFDRLSINPFTPPLDFIDLVHGEASERFDPYYRNHRLD